MDRYSRNKNMMSDEEIQKLHDMRVCVLGCGGLGGYVIEMLARLGVGYLTVVDGDCFEVTNLNRQLLSTVEALGQSKAEAAKARVAAVNPEVTVTAITVFLDKNNAEDILKEHHVIVDALDQIDLRKMVAKVCTQLEIPLVHGAIAGWYGQVATILPGDRTLERIYGTDRQRGAELQLGNPSFTPALVASLQVSEVLKLLLNRGELLTNAMLLIDLFYNDFEVIEFS